MSIIHNIECKVCLENFNNTKHIPMVLDTCGHSVCIICIDHLKNMNVNGVYRCPICRQLYNNVIKNYSLCEILNNSTTSSTYETLNIDNLMGINFKSGIMNIDPFIHPDNDDIKIDLYRFESMIIFTAFSLKNGIFDGGEAFFDKIFKLLGIERVWRRRIRYNMNIQEFNFFIYYFQIIKSVGFPNENEKNCFKSCFENMFQKLNNQIHLAYRKYLENI